MSCGASNNFREVFLPQPKKLSMYGDITDIVFSNLQVIGGLKINEMVKDALKLL